MKATHDNSPFGRHAPKALMANAVRLARHCPTNWIGKRFAFVLRALAVRALRGRPLDVMSLGARMRLYPAHNSAEKNLLFTPQYFDPAELSLLAKHLSGDFVFIDIGANAGGYALHVASFAGPRSRILAIEPQPEMFERLSYNIRQNAFPGLKAYDCAVADVACEVTLFIDDANKGESSMRLIHAGAPGRQIKVSAKTLGGIVEEEGFTSIDAIKIDVEGAEELILEPFFRDVGQHLWPRLLVVEHAPTRWSTDLPAMIVAQGYRKVLTTRTNIVYERMTPR